MPMHALCIRIWSCGAMPSFVAVARAKTNEGVVTRDFEASDRESSAALKVLIFFRKLFWRGRTTNLSKLRLAVLFKPVSTCPTQVPCASLPYSGTICKSPRDEAEAHADQLFFKSSLLNALPLV
eukprot:1011532-Pelagomonas_calceolata.AAC.3